MKLSSFLPHDGVLWTLTPHTINRPLLSTITTDVVVVGGGMAGLSTAQAFRAKGCNVVLLEKNYCGAGASGKSSGFVTPDSELSLSDFIDKFGKDEGKRIWEFIASGVERIRKNIFDNNLSCDYQPFDTLILAHSQKAFNDVLQKEYDARTSCNYTSRLSNKDALQQVVTSSSYYGGLSYGPTFAMDGYHYCRGMKEVLEAAGVTIYEETPLIQLEDHRITTPYGSIRADHIVICMDHSTQTIPYAADKIYQVQTFLMASAPLSDAMMQRIFPNERYMVWDTELIYQYFRPTGDNRLLLGGADIFNTYTTHEFYHNRRAIRKLIRYFQNKFPDVKVQFDYIWPGMIGVTKDLFPLSGHDPKMPSVYYNAAATGLPWSAAIGQYSAEAVIDGKKSFDAYFNPERSFIIKPWMQTLIGKRLSFALSHFLTVSSL